MSLSSLVGCVRADPSSKRRSSDPDVGAAFPVTKEGRPPRKQSKPARKTANTDGTLVLPCLALSCLAFSCYVLPCLAMSLCKPPLTPLLNPGRPPRRSTRKANSNSNSNSASLDGEDFSTARPTSGRSSTTLADSMTSAAAKRRGSPVAARKRGAKTPAAPLKLSLQEMEARLAGAEADRDRYRGMAHAKVRRGERRRAARQLAGMTRV